MTIITIDTDFVVHQEDKEWTTEEIRMIENYQTTAYAPVSKTLFEQIAQQAKSGNVDAWKVLYART
ncbi:hypothetical protein [Actinobacillus porcinus]|uniref:hypothetical protein n=1 Tax=Actinobacillus porcinus TaxID=51048 RepID=UPI0023522FFB|nr:hypothetical protein [Actinobacillus porcinus]